MPRPSGPSKVHRISVSLPRNVFEALDQLVTRRGFESRSQAIAEMIRHHLADHLARDGGEALTAGTITVFYDPSKPGLAQALANVRRRHRAEVVSAHQVFLADSHTVEVIHVRGPGRALDKIKDELVACKGVLLGRLTVLPSLLPAAHAASPSPAQPPAVRPKGRRAPTPLEP